MDPRISPNNDLLCFVCGSDFAVGKVMGAKSLACAACKKFFKRNKNCPALSCIAPTKQGPCQISLSNRDKTVKTAKRVNCPKCRLDKCVEIGMKSYGIIDEVKSYSPTTEKGSMVVAIHRNKESHNEIFHDFLKNYCNELPVYQFRGETNTPTQKMMFSLVKNPPRPECAEAERTISSLLGPIGIVSKLPYIPMEFPSDVSSMRSIWPAWLNHFTTSVKECSAFVKKIPGFTLLPTDDRRKLFASAFTPMSLSPSTQPNSIVPSFYGLPETTRAVMFHHFPMLKLMESRTMEIAEAMRHWQPTVAEFALLQAIIFYRPDPDASYQQPDIIINSQKTMLMTLRSLIASRSDDPASTWTCFNRTLTLLLSLNQLTDNFFKEARQHPEQFLDDKLFFEIFQ